MAKNQDEYNATLTQAVGRALRQGQKKPVHVYQFLAVQTIDVNIVQMRRSKTLVSRHGEYLLLEENHVLDTDQQDLAGAPFEGAACSCGDFEVD